MTIRLLAIPVVAMALVAAACGGSSSSSSATGATSEAPAASTGESEGGTTTIAGDQANDRGTKDASGMDEISIELDDFYFDPTVLTGKPGQKLKIELENEGGTEHNFSIDDQSIDQDVQNGGKETVTVTFPSSGELEFYCKYHRQMGMVGALKVG